MEYENDINKINKNYEIIIHQYFNKNLNNMNLNELMEFSNNIKNIKNTMYRLNNMIDKITYNLNCEIEKKCNHNWIIDNTFRDERTSYKCNLCNNYK